MYRVIRPGSTLQVDEILFDFFFPPLFLCQEVATWGASQLFEKSNKMAENWLAAPPFYLRLTIYLTERLHKLANQTAPIGKTSHTQV